MLIVTAGGWETHHAPHGVNGPIDDLVFPINHGVLYYPGYDVLPPFVTYRADRMDDAGFEDTSAALRQRMRACSPMRRSHTVSRTAAITAFPHLELRSEAVDPELVGFAAHVRHGL